MENTSIRPMTNSSFKKRIKLYISRMISRFEPANCEYERRLQALEKKWMHAGDLPAQQQQAEIEGKLYKDFELKFRGSSDLIMARLKERYEPLLKAQLADSKTGKLTLLDLGCGHGEFLEIAKTIGFRTIGVDQSSEALESSQGRHETVVGDLLTALQKREDASVNFMSFLHVIEHCSSDYTTKVFREVERCLVDGGTFLVETPSLYSLWASSRQFYLDPTHIRPIHPEYIQFLARSCGFTQGEVREYGKVEHPEACDFTKIVAVLNDAQAAKEIKKLDKWLYGPMDLACIFKK